MIFFLRFCLFGLEIFVIVEGKLRHFNFLAEKTWLQFYLGSLIKFNIEVSVSFLSLGIWKQKYLLTKTATDFSA